MSAEPPPKPAVTVESAEAVYQSVKAVIDEGQSGNKTELFVALRDAAKEMVKQDNKVLAAKLLAALPNLGFAIGTDLKGKNDEKRKELFVKCQEYAEKAVQLDPNSAEGFCWIGIMISELAEYEGNKKKIELSFKMKENWEKAIAIDPNHVNANFCLGKWCFEVASLSWLEAKAAALFFATPPTSTYDEALKYLLHAEKVGPPNWYIDLPFTIGKVLYKLGRKTEAADYFKKVMDYPHEPAYEEENRTIKKECQKWL